MPKGYNKDGTKKVRPAASGRKAKPGKKISPKITLDAAAILATITNLNKFISEAILEKAANDAAKKAAKKVTDEAAKAPGQVDLVEMLEEIQVEQLTEKIQKQAEAEPEPVVDFYSMSIQDQIREREFQRRDRDQADLDEWINMPAVETWKEIQRLLKHYNKKPQKSALFIQLRAIIPAEFFELRQTWRCWLEVTDDTGKLVDGYKQHASARYVEEIFNRKDWKYVNGGNGLSFYILPVGNAIKEKKPKVAKPRVAKPAKAITDGTLLSLLGDGPNPWPLETGPAWEPGPEELPEPEPEAIDWPAWMVALAVESDYSPLSAL